MINPMHHLSNALGIIGIILMFIVLGVNSNALFIAAFIVELVGFIWSIRLDDELITTRGYLLCFVFCVLIASWGISLMAIHG